MAVETVTAFHHDSEVAGNAEREPALRISNVVKTFKRANGTTIRPIDDVSLDIDKGEFIVLLGPSGCGKTTLLRCVAGLETPEEGLIEIEGRRVVDKTGKSRLNISPEDRRLGMIFQSYALWPHLTVAKNVSYPLEAARVPKAERKERVARALEMVGISDIAEQVPGRLSGGQQQRVSLARALVGEPSVILFDEPLSNVDAKVREELRLQLIQMQQRIGFTAIYVTHDQIEAMELADRIAVLRDGKIAQLDTPENIYDHPASRYVAKFIGTANELTGTVLSRDGSTLTVDLPGGSPQGSVVPAPASGEQPQVGDRVHVTWRPERTKIGQATPDSLVIRGQFLLSRYLGATSEVIVELPDGSEMRATTPRVVSMADNTDVDIVVDRSDLRVFAVEDER